jgi:hypothetical protein
VPDPNQPNVTQAAAYPAVGEETTDEGYPGPADPNSNGNAVETPVIQPQGGGDARSLSTQPPLNQPAEENSAAQSDGSSTLFLWVGFTAALLIFGGGIVGSIFLFTRRSNQR